jgi:hypothetical protein
MHVQDDKGCLALRFGGANVAMEKCSDTQGLMQSDALMDLMPLGKEMRRYALEDFSLWAEAFRFLGFVVLLCYLDLKYWLSMIWFPFLARARTSTS